MLKIIEGLTRKVHEGEIFSARTRIIPIGAFVEILPGKEGMVHISQLSEARVERVEDVVRQGDEDRVREIDSRGRINLTLRGVAQNGGTSYPEPTQPLLLLLIKALGDIYHLLIISLISEHNFE